MNTEDDNHISRHLLEKLWNEKDKYIIDELIADSYSDHTTPPYPDDEALQGPELFKQVAVALQEIFFSIHVTIKEQIAEGDKVVTHAIWECTLKTDDKPPVAGQVVTTRGIGIDRIDDGLIVENWNTLDVLFGLISQFNLADPFVDPNIPAPTPPDCKGCVPPFRCLNDKCVR